MKKRILNIIEIVIQLIAMSCFFCIVATDIDGNTRSLYEFLNFYPLYYIPIYTLWALNLIVCLVSAIFKTNKKDGKVHCFIAIMIFILNTVFILAVTDSMENNAYKVFFIAMFILIIVSFVKRANIFNDHIHNVQVVNVKESNADEVKKYKELLDSGVITQEEFDAKKKQLLGL